MKKTFVLVALFILPILAYLFFLSGTTNFGKLPTLTENIQGLSAIDSTISLKNKITILGFLGKDIQFRKGNAFNLNEKIYKRFHEFHDFQFVMLVPFGTETEVEQLKKELGSLSEISKWLFAYGSESDIKNIFKGLKTDLVLEEDLFTPFVFVIDKDLNLRGRDDDEDEGTKYGFNTASVADLNNKMVDDVKIILAEYRLALKKNNVNRQTK